MHVRAWMLIQGNAGGRNLDVVSNESFCFASQKNRVLKTEVAQSGQGVILLLR